MKSYFSRHSQIAKDIAKSYIGFFLARFFPKFADRFFLILNKKSDYLYTHHKRPRLAKNFNCQSDTTTSKQLAIVIQGSLGADDFVCETVKIYKKIFPDAHILVSTWLGESASTIQNLSDAGARVILNEKPVNRGISNVNLQIVSTRSGIEVAKELGSVFVLKTRSDQRMYATNIFSYLTSILSTFPPYSEMVIGRIIGVSLNTFLYRMYGLSDMLMFGHTDDLLRFWSVKLDERDADSPFDAQAATLREFAEWCVCEVYLTTEYLKTVGHMPKWTLEDSWDAFRKYFCIIDKESIDLFWNKYTATEYRWLRYHLRLNIFHEIAFKDWLLIYKNCFHGKVDENVLSERISTWVANNE